MLHMRFAVPLAIVTLLSSGCSRSALPGVEAPERAAADPAAIVNEATRLAAVGLWPGFDLRQVPLAVYDGERTMLFRHPSPPAGFEAVPGVGRMWVLPGSHPAVTANTSIELAGTLTATVMPFGSGVSLRDRAALVIHEAFHVFQRKRHPSWVANEVELFTWPVEVAEWLAMRRLESEALRLALTHRGGAQSACWTRAAMELRRARFAELPPGAVEYERKTELNEGLATYVEYRARGDRDHPVIPSEEYLPEEVRQRAYSSGLALALLLDESSPGWPAVLEQDDTLALDVILTGSVANHPACQFAPVERERIQAIATRDAANLIARREAARRAFLGETGWRLIIVAEGAPLFPQRFDPLNVQVLAPGEVLHTRFLTLGSGAGFVEVLGRSALTEAAGVHPLFNGVRLVTLTGFAEDPVHHPADGVVLIRGDGVSGELRGATVGRTGPVVTIRLPPAGR
jgi:hypothetical protein